MGTQLVVVALAIIFSAFFSGVEIAFLSSNKLRFELERKHGRLTSRILDIFYRNKEQFIATMLVGNNITLVIYGIVTANILTPLLKGIEEFPTLLLLVQTLIATAVILLTGEFLPKSIFRQYSNSLMNFFAFPILLFYVIFYPISKFITWLSYWILRIAFRLKINRAHDNKIFGKVDLDHLVEQAASADEKSEEQELKIFQKALDFSEVRIRDCMIPRTDIEAVDINDTIDNLKKVFVETMYSRLPVYKDSIDNIIGYVNSKSLFLNPKSIKDHLIDIEFFPETMKANEALTHFIKGHKSIAVVVDEFGGTAGLVTIEDIIEEIFGEIDDEHDRNDLVEKKLSDTEYILSARVEVSHINEVYGLEIPESDEYETIAGFILHHHQSIPKPGDIVNIDIYEFKILKTNKTRIELVRLTINR
ncbi:MAG: magnesium and cobalt exporter, family [Tenuifilum sp.]|jgi:CBS domain containing-hemolysin-like protein|uniref:hemolysin family protein n=1 Tax=Tenuifilum sp. TaxID=2760880 RepID=UPI0024AB0E3A|nr:hemolysin family protein [Tenuifilum sp.]MDI3526293.1 magnesium and cobalt exporter, family [Tenuifilum sp.]